MGRRGLIALAVTAAAGAVGAAGCGAGTPPPSAPTPGPSAGPPAVARCPEGPVPPNPTPSTLGVYRAGPVMLVVGQDLAQVSLAATRADNGVGAFLHVPGNRRVTLSVDPGSQRSLGLQFTDMSGYGPGLRAVRFPTCPGRRMLDGQLTFVGGLALHATGCARLHVRVAGGPPTPLLVPVGNSLSGCPHAMAIAPLPSAAFPYLGVSCGVPSWVGCDRIGVGVHLTRPAILVTVQVDGRLVTLSPPLDGSDLWQGVLLGAGPHHGPLAVRARHGHWDGEPPVYPRVRVTAYFADGTSASRAGTGYLHAGYG